MKFFTKLIHKAKAAIQIPKELIYRILNFCQHLFIKFKICKYMEHQKGKRLFWRIWARIGWNTVHTNKATPIFS